MCLTLTPVQRKIMDKLTAPDKRGKQIKVGPSALGGCPYCLGKQLAFTLPKTYPDLKHKPESNYAAWFGTMIHYALDKLLGLGMSESKWPVYFLEGYGQISGSVDLVLDNEVVDFKVVGKSSFDKMRLAKRKEPDKIPLTGYRVQQMTYAYALRQAGHEIEAVNLMVFNKTGWQWKDVVFYRELYNEQLVLDTFARLEKIWGIVQEGKLEDLPYDKGCFNCDRW